MAVVYHKAHKHTEQKNWSIVNFIKRIYRSITMKGH